MFIKILKYNTLNQSITKIPKSIVKIYLHPRKVEFLLRNINKFLVLFIPNFIEDTF